MKDNVGLTYDNCSGSDESSGYILNPEEVIVLLSEDSKVKELKTIVKFWVLFVLLKNRNN